MRSPDDPFATALLVEGDTVAWVGSDEAARGLTTHRSDVTEMRLNDAAVLPAFVDSHVHATLGGLALAGPDLSRCRTSADILARLRATTPHPAGVLVARGWDPSSWSPGELPSAAKLHRAAQGRPLCLVGPDGHGLALPGLTPPEELMGSIGSEHRRGAQQALRADAAAHGVGCLHEMAGPSPTSQDDLADLLTVTGEHPGPDVLAPGVLLATPATAEQVAAHVQRCVAAGRQAVFPGADNSLAEVLTGLEQAASVLGLPALTAGRHRLENLQRWTATDAGRIARLGLVVCLRPDPRPPGPDYAQLAAAGVLLAVTFPITAGNRDPWGAVRAALSTGHGGGLSARAAFSAATRGGWRAVGDDTGGVLTPGAPATFAVWAVTGELVVQRPDERVTAWSTDPRAAVPGLPDLSPGSADPVCLRTVVRGRVVHDAGVLGPPGLP